MQKSNVLRYVNFVFIAVAVIIATVLAFTYKNTSIQCSFANSELRIKGPSKTSYTVSFADISFWKYYTSFEKGEVLTSRYEKGTVFCGNCYSEDIGEYLYVGSGEITTCIFVESRDGTKCVFNYKDEKTTAEFYSTLKNTLVQYDYDVQYE